MAAFRRADVVMAVATVFVTTGASGLKTAAVLVITAAVTAGLTRATTVTVRVLSTGRLPNWQSGPAQTPPSASIVSRLRPRGSWSLISTLRARPGPVLVKRSV